MNNGTEEPDEKDKAVKAIGNQTIKDDKKLKLYLHRLKYDTKQGHTIVIQSIAERFHIHIHMKLSENIPTHVAFVWAVLWRISWHLSLVACMDRHFLWVDLIARLYCFNLLLVVCVKGLLIFGLQDNLESLCQKVNLMMKIWMSYTDFDLDFWVSLFITDLSVYGRLFYDGIIVWQLSNT